MIQLRFDGRHAAHPIVAHSLWRAATALLRATLIGVSPDGTFGPRRHLLQPGADDLARRLDARASLSGASAQEDHFEKWFARYQLPLLDYLFGMTRDRESAADLVQETFLHAYRAAGPTRRPSSIRTHGCIASPPTPRSRRCAASGALAGCR